MKLKEKILNKEKCLGAFLAFPSPEIIEILGLTGWDLVVIDLEHGSMTRSDIAHLFRAAENVNLSIMVRVPENNPKTILGALDLGAEGIIVPMVNSSEDAYNAVAALHYPPKGIRGLSLGRAARYGIGMTAQEHAARTEDLVLAVQIESRSAVIQAKEISSVSGVDIVFIGPSDLSADFNLIGQPQSREIQEIITDIGSIIKEKEKIAGIFCTNKEMSEKYLSEGYSFLLTNVMPCLIESFKSFKDDILGDN